MSVEHAQDPVAAVDWQARARTLQPPSGLFVGGETRSAVDGGTRPVVSPRDGASLVDLAWARVADVDQAVAEAREAFDHGPWPRMHPRERGEALLRLADLVEQDRDEIALLVSLEMGKPIRHSHEIELRALIRCLRFYGQIADKESGDIPPAGEGALALVTREPAGVVAAVVPWNFPLTLAGWKFAPALAAGCTVVLKTAERSPLSMQYVAALGVRAGLPPGVLNVLSGDGAVVGRRLGEHPDVDVLTFTGSTQVGRHFLRYAADSNLKRVYLELGGKSPNIILPDAPDLDVAADTAAWAIFFNAGEMCTAGSRLVVHRAVADQVLQRIVATSREWYPADPLLASTKMGPLVDRAHRDRVLDTIHLGVEQGAELLIGGHATLGDTGGHYLEPTVLTGARPDNVLIRDEIFGPVLAVQVVDDEDEAIAVAGDTPYGLAAAVWTSDLGTAHRVSRRLRAGTVWVNCYEEGDMNVPFGGVKLSGFGRDKSRHALEEYTDLKTTWIQYG
jgi:4-(gamma-glutamylamino)butanal dehydrogenase